MLTFPLKSPRVFIIFILFILNSCKSFTYRNVDENYKESIKFKATIENCIATDGFSKNSSKQLCTNELRSFLSQYDKLLSNYYKINNNLLDLEKELGYCKVDFQKMKVSYETEIKNLKDFYSNKIEDLDKKNSALKSEIEDLNEKNEDLQDKIESYKTKGSTLFESLKIGLVGFVLGLVSSFLFRFLITIKKFFPF